MAQITLTQRCDRETFLVLAAEQPLEDAHVRAARVDQLI